MHDQRAGNLQAHRGGRRSKRHGRSAWCGSEWFTACTKARSVWIYKPAIGTVMGLEKERETGMEWAERYPTYEI
jgi:hypothetical protein